MASSSTSSSIIIPSKTTYDVFLSFRGPDTRQKFTSHLHAALLQKDLITFIDDSIDKGEEISLSLMKVIEESSMSVIIFSEQYASSRWCLEELEKIMKCVKTNGRKVLPIFYNVYPADVRHQIGDFGKAFDEVKEKFKENKDKIERWIFALREAANLSGWVSSEYKRESELIEGVVLEIKKKLYPTTFIASTRFVGIDSNIDQILSLLCLESNDVRFIGIWGMGGIGKTTIAEALFSQISDQFQECCFLSDVRERSSKDELRHLQKCLVSKLLGDLNLNMEMLHVHNTYIVDRLQRKKVIVVLDDVNDSEQLDALAGDPADHTWFGPGSRVIVTGRDKKVLDRCNEIYEVKGLKHDDALQLFSMKAFRQKHQPQNFTNLSMKAVHYANGVPLALKILGSHLYKRSLEEWEIVLSTLKQFPDADILKILKISYDGLDQKEKDIFLDIACFFKGTHKKWAKDILNGCGFPASRGIIRLREKCLVTVVDDRVQMHDLIQEMGRDIAQQKGSHLWNHTEILDLLTTKGKKSVECIFLDMSQIGKVYLSPTAFSRMPNLRLLKFYEPPSLEEIVLKYQSGLKKIFQYMTTSSGFLKLQSRINKHRNWGWNKDVDQVKKDVDFKFESNYLQYLPHKLSFLHLEKYPCISLPSNFFMENLVELYLKGSKIEQLWDGNKCPQKLKYLNLSKCNQLMRLPPNLCSVTNLEHMDLSYCTNLLEIPSSIERLHNLTFLDLSYCSNLKLLQEIPRKIKTLELLGCGLEGWSASVQYFDNLKSLNIRHCRNLKSLPGCFYLNDSVGELNLKGCWNLNKFPDVRGNPRKLGIYGTGIQELPTEIGLLSSLVVLELKDCTRLESLPSSICKLKRLSSIVISECSKLENLHLLTGLQSLKELYIQGTAIVEISLSMLQVSSLKTCNRLRRLPEFSSQLKMHQFLSFVIFCFLNYF